MALPRRAAFAVPHSVNFTLRLGPPPLQVCFGRKKTIEEINASEPTGVDPGGDIGRLAPKDEHGSEKSNSTTEKAGEVGALHSIVHETQLARVLSRGQESRPARETHNGNAQSAPMPWLLWA